MVNSNALDAIAKSACAWGGEVMDEAIRQLSREAHRDDCSRDAAKQYFMALEAKIAWMEQEAHAASTTIERLREALHYYADKSHWHVKYGDTYILVDEGRIARAALGEGK